MLMKIKKCFEIKLHHSSSSVKHTSSKITPSVIELRRGGGGSELVALHEERGITRSTLVLQWRDELSHTISVRQMSAGQGRELD